MFDMFRVGRADVVAWEDHLTRFSFEYLKGYAEELVEAVLKLLVMRYAPQFKRKSI